MRLHSLILAGLLALTGTAWADSVKIDNAWARATAPGQKVAAAFANLTADSDMRLVRAESPVAETVELHTMAMENGVMIMRQVQAIDLPKGQMVSLKPGGLHIMLIGLKAPLKAGEKIPLRLLLRAGEGKEIPLEIRAEVRAMVPGHMHHH